MKIAVIGGAGYIGSHTIIELYKAGHSVVAVDNLVNSCDESLRRVGEIVGQEIPFIKADARDAAAMDKIFKENLSKMESRQDKREAASRRKLQQRYLKEIEKKKKK